MDTNVAIIGAGIGGVYLAAELGILGCRLRLHDIDDSRLADIRSRGGLDVEGHGFGTPSSWQHKYIAEDVPAGLIPMSELGKAAGVPTSAIDAVILLAKTLAGTDFATEARNLDRLGLAGMDAGQIRRIFATGVG